MIGDDSFDDREGQGPRGGGLSGAVAGRDRDRVAARRERLSGGETALEADVVGARVSREAQRANGVALHAPGLVFDVGAPVNALAVELEPGRQSSKAERGAGRLVEDERE